MSILIAAFMYPKTMATFINSGKNVYIAKRLSTSSLPGNIDDIRIDKIKIVLMFDDGWESVYTEAYEIMKQYGYKGSIPVIPSLIDENEYLSYEQLAELYLQGWDLLNHSYSHKEEMYDNSAKLLSEFNKAKKWMKNRYIGRNSDIAVIPYGEINPYLIKELKDAGYRNVRTSDNILVLDKNKIEYYPVKTINLLTPLSVDEVIDVLMETFDESKTVIFILHKIGDGDDGFGMRYSKDKFEQIIQFIHDRSDKFEIVTYSQLF